MTFLQDGAVAARHARKRWSWVLGGALVAAILVVLLAPAFDSDTIGGAEPSTADFGFPIAWVQQDLSSLDPPGAVEVGPTSPWEHPVTVSVGPLVLDTPARVSRGGVCCGPSPPCWSTRPR